MSQLPTDWLKKLFDLMNEFYGERWSIILKNNDQKSLYETIWNSALKDLSYEEIKEGLKKCRDLARIKFSKPPNQIEFYHWCLKITYKKIEKTHRYVPRRT